MIYLGYRITKPQSVNMDCGDSWFKICNYINVFLKLLGIPDDEEARKLLTKKAVALPAPPDSHTN